MTNIGLKNKFIILFGIILIIVVANYFIIGQVQDEAQNKQVWVEHTYNVIIESTSLLNHLKDAETGQRGFLLTSDPQYLEPYHVGIIQANHQIAKLQRLTSDNPGQQKVLKEVSLLMKDKFAELASTVEALSSGNRDKALKIVNENTGKRLMDQIQKNLHLFLIEEKRLLNERNASYKQIQEQLKNIFLIEVLFWVIMIYAVLKYVKKKLVSPLISMEKELRRLESGKECINIDTSQNDEIGSLAKALVSMHRTLISRTEKLEHLSLELEKERDNALHISSIDILTGLYNRRKFEETGLNELRRARRENTTISLIMIDIDHFKNINDIYGHSLGDTVLQKVSDCLKHFTRRPNDFAFRIGGEEFVLLTSGLSNKTAYSLACSLGEYIEAMQIPNQGSNTSKYVTISAGVVTTEPGSDIDIYDLLNQADQYLYQAKNQGRNRVISSGS